MTDPREKTPGRGTVDPATPVYPIGVAARLLNVHPRTLRIYEAEGLVRPRYAGARRLFSQNDIDWIACLRSMIHDEGISIPGLKKLLALVPCWAVADCPPEIHRNCRARVDLSPERCRSCRRGEEEEDRRDGLPCRS
ncbi:MerR family transcriptional regulator [Dissulfurirhabdus thermomarina]|uniref:MerR family transcriptional regulator n=1 Tax=Dissulfurirhabdus thermomarina TaxID=1765737 RepID=A0A6N9TRH6_DISTH|nr:MerR family transcriptional regulator [Dissulfurirhabdus thermomarina]NDY42037.1 MerR family transcriptional regulator [Dissulfurirhabdus thermomarina]NMX24548.1 MerR family transcriptional regulator [Dissulfurirhabdus thermomarina]